MELKKYIVVDKQKLTENITTLYLTLADGTIPTYRPGQYIRIYFPEILPFKGKEYSLSSYPEEKNLSITVQAVGRFSNKLCSLVKGDTFQASLPQGLFNLERITSETVMIAGGMGISPFRGIIFNSIQHASKSKLSLLQSARVQENLLFKNELDILVTGKNNLQIYRFVTRESGKVENFSLRRITIDDILGVVTNLAEANFMICGSTSFNAGFRKELISAGVNRERIFSETLF